MPLTLKALINNGLLDELARCFTREVDANLLLAAIDFPPAFRPNFNRADTPMDFWLKIAEQIDNGRVTGGFEPLLAQAAARFPGNPHFAPFARQPGASSGGITAYPQAVAESYDVFFSFSSQDLALVKSIARRLTSHNISVWLDEWVLEHGKPFVQELEAILSTVTTVVVFYGSEGYGPWQRAEVDIALDRAVRGQCQLIPVMLPGVTPADLPPFLRRLHSVRVADTLEMDGQDIIDQLVRAIRG